jgi:hypothetical protein
MSTIVANIAQTLTQEKEVPKAEPRRYKARMATKVRWALGDAMNRSIDAQNRMKRITEHVEEVRTLAEELGHSTMLMVLGRMDHEMVALALLVAEMERITRDAIEESKAEPRPKSRYSEL